MANFDSILKKGKGAAVDAADPKDDHGKYISIILQALMKLNAVYKGDKDEHFVHSIEQINCKKCSAAMYLLSTTDINGSGQILKWRLGDSAVVGTEYLCANCK